jgi:hypothetical protein
LKSKLPLGKKPKGDDEESEEIEEESNSSQQADRTAATDISVLSGDEEESEEPKSIVDKIKAALNKKQKGKAEAEEGEAGSDDDAAAAAKKKKSKMIQIAVGAGLVLFLLSDYIIPPEEPAAPAEGAVKLKSRKRPNKKKPGEAAEQPADTAQATAPTETPATETPAVTAPTETPPVDTTITETTPESPVEVTSTDVPTEPVTEPVIEPTTEPTPETPAVETQPIDTAVVETPPTETVTTPVSPDVVDGGETTTNGDENITDQILQDLESQAKENKTVEQKKEYVSPPDYEYRGRGLVYNCTGKHWACVDGPSYKTCEDNSSSTKYLKKTSECYPFNIYETQKGCEVMQNRQVTAAAKTKFCGE